MKKVRRIQKKYVIKATTYDKKGRKIAIAFNDYHRTHPLQKECADKAGYPFKDRLHAEVAVLIKSRGSTVYRIRVERYDSDGNPKLAKPCPVCEVAIALSKIGVVEYTQ